MVDVFKVFYCHKDPSLNLNAMIYIVETAYDLTITGFDMLTSAVSVQNGLSAWPQLFLFAFCSRNAPPNDFTPTS